MEKAEVYENERKEAKHNGGGYDIFGMEKKL